MHTLIRVGRIAMCNFARRPVQVNSLLGRTFVMPERRRMFSTQNSDVVREEVTEKIMQILKSSPKCNQAKLTPKATFEELGFDSLDMVELVVAMEEHLGVELKNEEAEKITGITEAIDTFHRYRLAKVTNQETPSK